MNGQGSSERTALKMGFAVPDSDLRLLLESLGCKLFTHERTLSQYVVWSMQAGLFSIINTTISATQSDVVAASPLTEAGTDSLLGVLCALNLVVRSSDGRYALSMTARDYLLEDSPYYVGDQLRHATTPMPQRYLKKRADLLTRARLLLRRLMPQIRFGSRTRIFNQHARNLGACAAAVRTGEFASARCVVDMAGGSGTFSIPFALDYPNKRVILTDLPNAIENVRPLLTEHHLDGKIELLSMDAFSFPWCIPECDTIFIGNFLHGFHDDACRRVCQEAHARLQAGGRLWLHEMPWNDTRDGPLLTALWHATMRSAGPGRQRTRQELSSFLTDSGFVDIRVTPSAGGFVLISGSKPVTFEKSDREVQG
jgi:hypothetical protein